MTIKHIFVSPDPDDADTSLVRPTNWNDFHALEQEISGNTNGALTIVTGTRIVLAALGIASLGITGSTIGISVPPGGGAGDGYNILAAGTQTANTTGTVLFQNSNGISFGMSNSSVITASYTVPAQTVQPGIQSISAGTTRATTGEVVWANANGISFGLNGNTLTASYTVPTFVQSTQPGIQSISAGTTRATTGEVVWANSNGISFGLNGNTLTASYTVPNVPAQTVQTIGGYAVGQTTGQSSSSTVDARSFSIQGAGGVSVGWSNGTFVVSGAAGGGGGLALSAGASSQSNGTIVFSNSNGISFGMNNGTITATVTPGAAAGLAAGAAGTQTATSGTLNFVNSNGISFGMSGSSQITASYTVPTQTVQPGIQSISAGTTRATTGEVVWANSNGISFGLNGQTLTASYTVPTQTVQPGIQSISAGTTRATTGEVIWANSNGISFGMNAGTVTASYTVPSTAGLLSAVNLSAGTTSSNASAFVFSNSNNVSFGLNGATFTATATFAQSVQTQSNVQGIGAGTQTGRTGDVVFANSNGITFGMSGSSQVTASYTVPSTAGLLSAVNLSAGTTSQNLSAFVFSNSNGMSFGLNGSTITGSYTVPTQSVQTVGLYASSQTTGQSSSSTADARSITFVGMGGVSVGLSGGSYIISGATGGGGGGVNSATMYMTGNTTQSSNGTVSLSSFIVQGAGGVSAGMSNGSFIVSGPPLTSLAVTGALSASSNGSTISLGVGTVTVSATGNTTQASSGTVNLNALVVSGAGNISVGVSGGSLVFSQTGGGGGGGAAISAGANSQSTGTVVWANSNGITFGLSNNGTLTASYNSTQFAGTGTTFAGANISASMTLNSNGLNLSASVAPPGAAAENNWHNLLGANTAGNTTVSGSTIGLSGVNMTLSGTNNSQIVLSVPATSSISATGLVSISTNGSTISIGVPGATASFFNPVVMKAQSTSVAIGNGSVFVQPLEDMGEIISLSRFNVYANMSISSSSNSSHAGAISLYMGIYTRNGSTLSLASSGSQSYQWTNTSNNSMASISSLRGLSVPMNALLTGGDYWIAMLSRTSTTNANWFTGVNARASYSSQQLQGLIGEASNSTRQMAVGMGLWSTTSTALPASIAIGDIRGAGAGAANNALPFIWNAGNFSA